MRSLFLVGPLGPPSGGVTSHLWDLRSAVVSLGGAVRMFDPARRGRSGHESGPPVARVLFDTATRTMAGGRLAAALGAARARGDLVHLHTNGHNHGSWEVIGLVGLLAGAMSPPPEARRESRGGREREGRGRDAHAALGGWRRAIWRRIPACAVCSPSATTGWCA